METPGLAAERLFLGLGIALLLITAFALIDGRLPPADCPEVETLNAPACTSSDVSGWLVPGAAALALALGLLMRMSRTSGDGSLFPRLFPSESQAEIAERLSEDHGDADDADRLSGDWAKMEVKMLESGHAEEE